MDGIQIDDNMHAIDHDFKAIPGLYVIGDMSGKDVYKRQSRS